MCITKVFIRTELNQKVPLLHIRIHPWANEREEYHAFFCRMIGPTPSPRTIAGIGQHVIATQRVMVVSLRERDAIVGVPADVREREGPK
jgi:hypothetical protein